MIIRRRRTRHYAVVPNHVLEDRRLSAEGRGVLAYLLSRPDNWEVSLRQLRNEFDIGKEKAERIVREIIEAGYARRERVRTDDRRHLAGWDYTVTDEPAEPEAAPDTSDPLWAENPTTEGVQADSLTAENLTAENPTTEQVRSLNNTGIRTKDSLSAPARDAEAGDERESEGPIDEGREEPDAEARKRWRKMRADYPHAGLDDLPRAEKLFMASSDADQAAMVEALPRWAAYLETQRIRPHLQNFIAHRRWELIPETETERPAPSAAPAASSAAAYVQFGFADQGWWALVWRYWKAGLLREFRLWVYVNPASGITVASAAAPDAAELAALVRIEANSPQFDAWAAHVEAAYADQRIPMRLPRPDKVPFVWVPSEWPPDANQPSLSEIDETIG